MSSCSRQIHRGNCADILHGLCWNCTEWLAAAWNFLRLHRWSGCLRRMAELHYIETTATAGD